MKPTYRTLHYRDSPKDHYDAVIIGGGIGGLVVSNLLAMNGLRVLLIEQHYVVGGYCSTFTRRGFTFDAASHFYPLLGNADSMTGKLLKKIGSSTTWIKMDPVDRFHFPDGSHFSVPSDFDQYLLALKTEFPEEAERLDDFFRLVQKLYMLGLLHYFRGIASNRLRPYLTMTLREALDEHFKSKKLKLLLSADSPHWGAPPNRTSFVFDSMLRLSYFQGNYYPQGGSQVFANELAQLLTSRGGDIALMSTVRKVVVDDGRATGVEFEIGPRHARRQYKVDADFVVSNADLRLTVNELVGKELFESEYIERINQLRPTYACFLSHIGVRGISREELERAHGYYWTGWDSDRMTHGDFCCKVFVPSLHSPTIAPTGSDVVIVQKVTDVHHRTLDEWETHKREVELEVMEHLDHVIPGFRDRVVVCLSATARTSNRFTLNYRGAMLGWQMSPDQLGDDRPDITSPIDNLFFVGQWTRPGGGITPVIISAQIAAERVLSAKKLQGAQFPTSMCLEFEH